MIEVVETALDSKCLDAIDNQVTVLVTDMATGTRWRNSRRGPRRRARSMLWLQLYVDADCLGSVNLYSHQPGAFDEESEHVGLLFASDAAIAYDTARTRCRLVRAVDTRQLIGKAQGLLMAREHLNAHQALVLRVPTSRHRKLDLRRFAEHLVTAQAATTGPGSQRPGR